MAQVSIAKSMEYLLSLGIPLEKAKEIDQITTIFINSVFNSKGVFNDVERKTERHNTGDPLSSRVRSKAGKRRKRTG
ncbi:hypothetical protein LJC18_04300 [Lachnospiraceae bacterium OttesenSCG-928-E19]|nr:hypothetical protein [Lachnospiraceae bacterium OttesenSCG-928-E19]